ncbi:erythromycin esterase family protein [Roseateles albus]|uniref:Erythromycin esterase family protein n=1 Tax=Roseateles albus TaxID=2987525 RepID=A0ABT5KEN4_9BURK|nr:erythromycin esterase family protein [Roseateles albus]MDC8772373.1 erythromycin esterase family protein [Roseateles albus]
MRFVRLILTGLFCAVLTACGGGSQEPGSATQEPATSTPVPQASYPDLTVNRLLTDAELLPPPPPASVQAPSAEEAKWLQATRRPLRSLVVDTDFSDLAFLSAELANRRIVQLGESSHGAREFNLMKVRLIKFMHEQLGYDVLAFESSLLACHLFNADMATSIKTPAQMTRGCLFGIWDTEELNELFRYIKSTHSSARPLQLAGFDIQSSSALDRENVMLPWFTGLTDEVDANSHGLVLEALKKILADLAANSGRKDSITGHAAPIVDLLQRGSAKASAKRRVDFEMAILALKAMQDRYNYDFESGKSPGNQASRERGMADALTGLAERAYPNAKIMVWAHNAHIATHTDYYPSIAPMGAQLKQRWGEQLFTIGLFMLRGQNVTDVRSKQAVQVNEPGRGSLEELAYSLNLAAAYLPIEASNQASSGDDWQHRPIQFRSWGTINHVDVLAANYNAVIIIDHTSIPRYNP